MVNSHSELLTITKHILDKQTHLYITAVKTDYTTSPFLKLFYS